MSRGEEGEVWREFRHQINCRASAPLAQIDKKAGDAPALQPLCHC